MGKGIVSLFSGAGGLDAGLEQAGFSTLVALDNDRDSVATLTATKEAAIPLGDGRTYLGEAEVHRADVTEMSTEGFLELWGRPRPPAAIVGGPPCQTFSSAGRMRGMGDKRGRLFRDFVRAARALKPDFVLFENVQGLVTARDEKGNVGGVLDLVREEFEDAGYGCSFALVNAADYGTPQRRVRLVMVGARRHAVPTFPPSPTHSRDGGEGSMLQPWVSVREALKSVPAPEGADLVVARPDLAEKLAAVKPGSGIRVQGKVENNRPGGHWGYRQDGFVADCDSASRTIRSASTPDWLLLADGSHRRLSWRECARLQGFPDPWAFEGTATGRFRQIGNAVPVQLGRALGDVVAMALNSEPLPLGEKPVSPEWPANFRRRIRYTRSEHRVNGALREFKDAA